MSGEIIDITPSSTIIKDSEDKYFLYFGNHLTTVHPSQLPKKVSGWLIETGTMANYATEPTEVLTSFKGSRQNKEVFRSLARSRTPVYFCDTHFGIGNTFKASLIETFQTPFPVSSSLAFLAGLVVEKLNPDNQDSAAQLKLLARVLRTENAFWTLRLRNVVWAHKKQWLAKHLGGEPFLGSILGSHHTGVADDLLLTPEDRLRYLSDTRSAWVPFVAPEVFPRIQQYKFDRPSNKWQPTTSFDVPELKALVS